MIRITGELMRYVGNDTVYFATRFLNWYFALLPFLKVLSFIACVLLVGGIVYAIKTGGYYDFYSDQWVDNAGGKGIVERKMRRKWRLAVTHMQNKENRVAWIAALNNAESIVQEAFRIKGYAALDDGSRSRIAYEAEEYTTLPDLKEAQTAYKKAENENMPFTHEEAVAGLRSYKKIIRETEILGAEFL